MVITLLPRADFCDAACTQGTQEETRTYGRLSAVQQGTPYWLFECISS